SLDRGVGSFQPDYHWPSFTAPIWSPDGQTIYFTAIEQGSSNMFALSTASGEIRHVSSEAADIEGMSSRTDGQTVVCLAATATHPYEVCAVPTSGGALRVITETNRALLDAVTIIGPEPVKFNGPDDWGIEGWLYKPIEAPRPYPLILHIHGGPQGC